MADTTDGERIAEERIAEAARTGQDWLDLGDLGALPGTPIHHLWTDGVIARAALSVILCARSVLCIRPRTYRRTGWRIVFWPRTIRAAVASILRPLD